MIKKFKHVLFDLLVILLIYIAYIVFPVLIAFVIDLMGFTVNYYAWSLVGFFFGSFAVLLLILRFDNKR